MVRLPSLRETERATYMAHFQSKPTSCYGLWQFAVLMTVAPTVNDAVTILSDKVIQAASALLGHGAASVAEFYQPFQYDGQAIFAVPLKIAKQNTVQPRHWPT